MEASAKARSWKGKRLGRYTLLQHLASGGMAEIFLARHEGEGGFGKDLVLKVLQDRYAERPEVVEMFLEEARLGAELRHPSIVDVYDVGQDAGVRFIAMEYIEGKTLTDLVLRSLEVSTPIPIGLTAHIVAQVAEGLGYMQEGLPGRPGALEVIHRDISPTNLVVSYAGQTKIIDFGIARRGRAVKEDSGARPGKMSYMSPEQVKGLALDGRSDIFSLGTILYEVTVGRRLWRGTAPQAMQRIVDEKPPPPTYVKRDYPPALELIVQKALEKRPDDRYQSAADLAHDLEAFLARSGERMGNRQVATFLHTITSPDAQISERGARRARAFQDDEGSVIDDHADEIDFDRPRPTAAGAALAHALRQMGPLMLETASGPRLGASPALATAALAPAAAAAGLTVDSGTPASSPTAPTASEARPRAVGGSRGFFRGSVFFLLALILGTLGAIVFLR